MLSSIHPLGERARHNRWMTTAGFYVLGSALGGLSIGLSLGLLGKLSLSWLSLSATGTAAALVALGLTSVAVDSGWLGLRLPSITRQVNEDWLTEYRGWIYGFGFGVQLGAAVTTIVTSATVYLTLVLATLAADPLLGAAIGGTFGIVRALPLLAVARVADTVSLRAWHTRMQAAGVHVRRVAAFIPAVLGVAAVMVVV